MHTTRAAHVGIIIIIIIACSAAYISSLSK